MGRGHFVWWAHERPLRQRNIYSDTWSLSLNGKKKDTKEILGENERNTTPIQRIKEKNLLNKT